MSFYEVYYYFDDRHVLGINDSGKVYLFEGFWQNDFQKFAAHYFNKIDSEEKAWNVAKFYFDIKNTITFLTINMKIEIITKENITNYSKFLDLIKPVEILKANGGYKVSFYVINKTTKAIDFGSMFVDCQGNVNCKSENVREPDFYYK